MLITFQKKTIIEGFTEWVDDEVERLKERSWGSEQNVEKQLYLFG